MTTRTTSLTGGPVVVAAGATAILYTAPSNKVTICKFVTAFDQSGIAGTLTLGVNGTGAANRFHQFVFTTQSQFGNLTCYVVLQPGDSLRATASAAGAVTVTASGSELPYP